MSVIERAQRARYYEVAGFPLTSLSIFNLQEAKRTHSLQYLEQVTNLCEKIKLGPDQYNKESTSNKLKLLKAFQYSIQYSRNLKAIYDAKEQQLTEKNTQLKQQIREKKQAIKLHKQKVDKRKAQYRQMKVDYTKSAYQTFSNEISNLKIKQEELNLIKLQLQSQIQIAKQQLNSPYNPQMFQPPSQPPNYSYYPDPSSFHHPFNLSNYNSFPKLNPHNQVNDFTITSPQLNNPNQGQKLFYQQNIQQQRGSKLKTQQSNFTLNGSWTVLDEENRIQEMNSRNSKQESNIVSSYKLKQWQQKKDSKGRMVNSNIKKLQIDTQINNEDQPQVLSSPTSNFIIPNTPGNIKPSQQQCSSSFDNLNRHISTKQSLVNKKSSIEQKRSINSSSIKQQSRQMSKIHDNDSLLLRRLKQESTVSKKSSQSSVEYKFQDEIKQTPNLNYYLQSNNYTTNDLNYSKIGDNQGDIWASTKGSTSTQFLNMKMFNTQLKRKTSDQQNARNTIQSYKQSNSIEDSESKQIKHIDADDLSSFDKLGDDLDDLDLGMDTRNSIVEIIVNDSKKKVEYNDPIRKIQNTSNNKKQFDVSINTLQQVPEESDSDLMKRQSIPLPPPALDKTQEKDSGEQDYYDEQFQDDFQQSKRKQNIQSTIKNQRQRNDYKSEVEIHVPSNTSFVDVNNRISKHQHNFRDIPNEIFLPKDQKFKNKTNGIFSEIQYIIDIQNKQQYKQSLNIKSDSINKNEQSQLDDSYDLPQETTIGKKPKSSQKQSLDTDESKKLLVLQHPLESKVIQKSDNSSTLKNQKESTGEKYLQIHSLTLSIPFQNNTQIHQNNQVIQQNEDSISQQIEYQFEDSSKFNQSQKQQIQRKIVTLLRNKNKPKSNSQLSEKIKYKQQQIKALIQKQINLNIINQSHLKGKQHDWKQVTKIFQNKINELKKQSGSSSQINTKLSEIQQKSNYPTNKKPNIGSKESSVTNSKLSKQNASEIDENVELNYSQSILKDQLKPRLQKKNRMNLSDVPSDGQSFTNSSNMKNQSLSFQGSLDFSMGQKSNLGSKKTQRGIQKGLETKKQQSGVLNKPSEEKSLSIRQNKLMGMQRQQQKGEQVSRSKYVKLSNPKTNASIPKQNAFTKINQSKYVSIQDPLNNQIAQKKSIIKEKVPDDDDEF